MPRPLSSADAATVRTIFARQARGEFDAIGSMLDGLENRLLMGTVQAQRYLGRYHRSSAQELTTWLEEYADHPDAPAIHALLLTRLPKGTTAPPRPAVTTVVATPDLPEAEDIAPDSVTIARNASLGRSVLGRAHRGDSAGALRLIAGARGLDAGYASLLRAEVAQILFTRNEDTEALRVALLALSGPPPHQQAALAGHIGGLAAWRLGRPWQARYLFERAVAAGIATPWEWSAAAYWAARVARSLGDDAAAAAWLRRAAVEADTLHGLLARRALGLSTGILADDAVLTPADVDAVAATPAGWRAFALLQVDQRERAEAELRTLAGKAQEDTGFARSLRLVATAVGLSDLGMRLAEASRAHEESDVPLVRAPRLRPAGGFKLDPALVYAVTRVESNFNAGAISPAGARGLMQLMPDTASYIGNGYQSVSRLHDPGVNLQLGQKYLAYLARVDGVGNDLVRVLASYNSGPGNFQRWADGVRDMGDPLLFLEAIPIVETRQFVTRALTYTWLYAGRLHLPAPSLDALAAGSFPPFTPASTEPKMTILTTSGN
ncbi:MAG: lytic transglycosylase domain-containing protein [Acetobacteraceae bacterium]